MDYRRFNVIRARLVELYKVITEYTFEIVAPPSTFMQLKAMKNIDRAQFLIGTERMGLAVRRDMTITKMTTAISLNGDETQMAFRFPSRDIPRVYESIQEYIQLWLEVKTDWGWFETARLEELEELEAVAKFIFTPYKEYHAAKIAKEFGYKNTEDISLVNTMRSLWMFGSTPQEELSFVSYVSLYKEAQGLTKHHQSSYGRSETLEELLGGNYGSGIQSLA